MIKKCTENGRLSLFNISSKIKINRSGYITRESKANDPEVTAHSISVGYTTKVPHWLEMGRIIGI